MGEDVCRGTFEREVLPHLDAAYNLAHWLIGSRQHAEDIVQEAYALAFLFFPSFRGRDTRVWLMRIVRDTCFAWLYVNRSSADAAEVERNPFRLVSQVPEAQELGIRNLSGTVMREALQKLSPSFREVLILRELEGMSYSEIAEITGRPTGAVLSSLSCARELLRHALTGLLNSQPEGGCERSDPSGGSA